jgi:hypothetical protein
LRNEETKENEKNMTEMNKVKKIKEMRIKEKIKERPPYFYWKVYITPGPHGFH